jgi:hypothetical protein
MEAYGWTHLRLVEEGRERSYLRGIKNGATLTASRWLMPKWMATTSYSVSSTSAAELSRFETLGNDLTNDPNQAEHFALTINFPYSDAELCDLGSQVADQLPIDAAVDWMLMLHVFLDDAPRASLLSSLREGPSPSANRWLTLATLEAEPGDANAAVLALWIARAIDIASALESARKSRGLELE